MFFYTRRLPPYRLENALGHYLHFIRDADQRLTHINAPGGVRVHLHYEHPLGRLTDVKRIVDQHAKGQWIRYEYDKAIRLTALVNENSAAYRFVYDASDRLSEEVRVDNLTRRFSYDAGGNLVRLDEIGYGENGERPERNTLFERDAIGRLLAKVNRDARQDFEYDEADRLLSIQRTASSLGKQLGITDEKLSYRYDLLGRLTQELTP